MKRLTDTQKEEIRRLRFAGNGYKKIADKMSLSRDTVRSFCVRNDIPAGPREETDDSTDALGSEGSSRMKVENTAGSEGSSCVKVGNTVFVVTRVYSKNATETLEQKLERLILNEAMRTLNIS